MTDWTKRPLKGEARAFALASPGPWAGYLSLPGARCCDLEMGLATGKFGPDSRVMIAECGAAEAQSIRAWLGMHWPFRPPLVHFGGLHKMAVPYPVDMAFLDYLGNPRLQDWDWMDRVLRPRLLPSASVALTAALATRGNAFQTGIERQFRRDLPGEWAYAQECVEPLNFPPLLARRTASLLMMTQAQLVPQRTVSTGITFYREEGGITMLLLRFDPYTDEENPFVGARSSIRRWIQYNLAPV
jgi:hypothetical protein